MPGAGEFRVQKADIEGRVVDDEPRIADEIGELVRDRREDRLVARKLVARAREPRRRRPRPGIRGLM